MANDELKEAKANAKAEKARAKAMRPWYAKKRFIIPGILILLIVIVAATSGSETSTDTNQNDSSVSAGEQNTESSEPRFGDRADIQETDLEILPGESATIDGMKLTVDKVTYTKSPSEFEEADTGKTYMIVSVTLLNESDETKSYNSLNYRVQTASGQVLDSTFTLQDNELGSGDLVAGGTVSGTVPIEVPVEEGYQYIIWKPDPFSADRAIIQTMQ